MSQNPKPSFTFLKLILYSLLAVLFIVFVFLIYSFILFNNEPINNSSIHDTSDIISIFPIIFTLLLILSMIFIIKLKSWAIYLFYLLSLLLIAYLLLQNPIDWLNIFILFLIGIIIEYNRVRILKINTPIKNKEENLEDFLNKED